MLNRSCQHVKNMFRKAGVSERRHYRRPASQSLIEKNLSQAYTSQHQMLPLRNAPHWVSTLLRVSRPSLAVTARQAEE